MNITSWPAEERPRDKLLKKGPSALSDAEILAIFLRTGRKGVSALDLARELLDKFQGLRQLIDSDESQFCQTKGLGSVKYVQIQAAIELGRRYLQAELKVGNAFTNPEQTPFMQRSATVRPSAVRPSARMARTKVSCSRSSASCGPMRERRNRRTEGPWWR